MREREPAPANDYEISYQYLLKLRDRGFNGIVVIDGEKLEWQKSRQGTVRFYMSRENDKGTCLKDWMVFMHDIRKHTGKHQHQGGLIIFVLEGEGYSVVNGQRVEWEAGDLMLLPIQPDGVEHQHFNNQADQSSKWIAFIFRPYQDQIAYYIDQKETAPDWRG